MEATYKCPLCGVEFISGDFLSHILMAHGYKSWDWRGYFCPCGWSAGASVYGGKNARYMMCKHIAADPDHFRAALVEQALLEGFQ